MNKNLADALISASAHLIQLCRTDTQCAANSSFTGFAKSMSISFMPEIVVSQVMHVDIDLRPLLCTKNFVSCVVNLVTKFAFIIWPFTFIWAGLSPFSSSLSFCTRLSVFSKFSFKYK